MAVYVDDEHPELQHPQRSSLQSPRPVLLGIGAALIAYLCWRILMPFLPAVCWALALAIVAEPIRAWLLRRSVRSGATAVIIVFVVLTVVIVPGVFLVRAVAGEVSEAVNQAASEAGAKNIWEAIQNSTVAGPALRWLDSQFDLPKESMQLAHSAASWASVALSRLVARSMWLLTQIAVTAFVLFYFVRDSETILSVLRSIIPLPGSRTDQIFTRIAQTIRVSLGGKILVASIQGVLGGLIFLWLGLPAPVFWGSVMACFSIFPILGAFVVWLPAALIFVLQGNWLRALLLAGWGVFIIHPVDNLLGPVLVGTTLRMHTLLMFFAVIGGLAAFGPSGIVLGPLIVAVVVALFERPRTNLREAYPIHER
jgi:predicted PurR-regulated permease PerM